MRRSQDSLRSPHGHALFWRSWLPPEPERVLLLVHGYAEHSGRYEHLGAWFAARGFAVYSYDKLGHGRSEGHRGHVPGFAILLDDLEKMLEHVRREHPGLPILLVGHSMGGLVTANLLVERHPDVAAAVLSAAALEPGTRPSRLRLALARLLRHVAPRLSLPGGIDPNGLSRDPEVVRAYVEDPFVFTHMPPSTAVEALAAMERTLAGAERVSVPVLVLHGQDDTICSASGSRRFHQALRTRGSLLRVYPKLRHEIFNEPEQEEIFRDMLDWLLSLESRS